MLDDFKKFIMRGNVMDLAVGVIIGGAFGKIVDSLVSDIIMPVVGLALGKVDFASLFVSLNGTSYPTLADAKKAAAPVLAYGSFLNVVVNFLILAVVIFVMVKQVNKLMPAPVPEALTPPAPAMKNCPECTSSIPAKARRCPQCTAALA
jgi:large conductance mechanosensitive channel